MTRRWMDPHELAVLTGDTGAAPPPVENPLQPAVRIAPDGLPFAFHVIAGLALWAASFLAISYCGSL